MPCVAATQYHNEACGWYAHNFSLPASPRATLHPTAVFIPEKVHSWSRTKKELELHGDIKNMDRLLFSFTLGWVSEFFSLGVSVSYLFCSPPILFWNT